MTKPDPSSWTGVVSAEVLEALRLAADALARANVRHVIVGGLAVAANGFPRATRDVDFLVGPEAFVVHASGLVTLRPEVPFQVNGVAIDLLAPEAHEGFLAAELEQPMGSILGAAPLVYMKLKASRRKDLGDVTEMVKGGIDVRAVRAYLLEHAPAMVADFDRLAEEAEAEE